MATPKKLNTKSPTIRRILREAQELAASPSPDLVATPLESDLFEWHFTLRGPPGSVYADGLYHGRIVLPPTYPLRPPSFRFLTPSGRFEPNREICLSISGHHEETWQPAWGVRTALVALRAFMESDPKGQVGGQEASEAVRRRMAADSAAFVCPICARSNAVILREAAAEAEAEAAKQAEDGPSSSSPPPPSSEEIPPELRLVFRDEIGLPSNTAAATAATASTAVSTPSSPPPPPAPAHAVPVLPTPTRPLPLGLAADPAAAAAITAAPPPPTTAASSAPITTVARRAVQPPETAPAQQQHQRRRRRRRSAEDAVPVWLDRTIVALCVVLAGMLLRMIA